jgi:hypothetical protein
VISAFFIAGEKSNPGTAPLLLLAMPASDGPAFTAASVAWQTPQRAAKARRPAAVSPAASADDELPRIITTTKPAQLEENFMSLSSVIALWKINRSVAPRTMSRAKFAVRGIAGWLPIPTGSACHGCRHVLLRAGGVLIVKLR